MWGTLLGALTGLGSLFGNTAKSRSDERSQENLAGAANYRTQQDALLRAQQLAMLQPGQTTADMIRGQLLASPPQDIRISHPRATMPNVSGGFSMANLQSPSSQLLGQAIQRNALLKGMKGYDTSGMVMNPPAYKSGNWLDTLLNVGGFAGGVANAVTNGTGIPSAAKKKTASPIPSGQESWY
jgi:hypothetical protein